LKQASLSLFILLATLASTHPFSSILSEIAHALPALAFGTGRGKGAILLENRGSTVPE